MTSRSQWLWRLWSCVLLPASISLPSDAVERTEKREPCSDSSATKRPMFRDLHVRTKYSFDSYVSSPSNVIFRNDRVTATAISTDDTGSRKYPELCRRLREECIEGSTGCNVISMPLNSNIGHGLKFPDPRSEQEAQDRLFFEPLVELIQHKAASECSFNRLLRHGAANENELCAVEQAQSDNLAMLGTVFGEISTDGGKPVSIAGDIYGECFLNSAEQPFYSPTIEERAGTCPIWVNPTRHAEDTREST